MVCGMSSSNAYKPPVIHGVGPSIVGIPAKTSCTAIDFLNATFSAVSRNEWLNRFAAGEIMNAVGRVMAPQDSLLLESHLYYYRNIHNEPELPFKARVIFQDDCLVVADKPHFMPVTPGGKYVQQSLLVQLKQALNLPELSPIHRIDRETAGLVLFSVRAKDRNAYQELFRQRLVEKTYEAIAGAPDASTQGLVFPFVHQSMMVEDTQFFKMREIVRNGASHQTEFNSETWIDCAGQVNSNTLPLHPKRQHPKSLARYILKPLTGQRHQLRVHMNALGLPLINDQLYPHVLRGADEADDFNAPLQLLAKMIVFKDPISGDLREFETQFKL